VADQTELVIRGSGDCGSGADSDVKRAVHDIVLGLPDDMGTGTAVWPSRGGRGGPFDREVNMSPLMSVYDALRARYVRTAHRQEGRCAIPRRGRARTRRPEHRRWPTGP
jgi:hypothetical protein